MKIFLILPTLNTGGAERVFLQLAPELKRAGHQVSLVLVNKTGRFIDRIPDGLDVLDLKIKRVIYSIIPIVQLIWKNKPDIVMSSVENLNLYLLFWRFLLPYRVRLVTRTTSIPERILRDVRYPRLYRILMSLFYSKADLIICQSSEMLESLHRVSSQPLRRVSIIPNPAPNAQEFSQDFCSIPRKKVLLSVGRLSDEKGFDLGLRAFAEMKGHNEFHYQLIGEGPALEGLKCLAQELGVSERVEFLGFQANPNKFYCRSHGYILPSRYEGFPNVLLEAMGMGLPVLAFDCLSDLRQMIKDGFNGFLVPAEDYVSMGKKLAQLVEDSWNREEISEDVRSRFGLQAISNSYIKAFNQIL